MTGGGLGDQEIHYDLALRRQQCAEPAETGRELRHVGGDEPVEKIPRILARDLDYAAVGKKRCLHQELLLKLLLKRK